MMFVGWVNRHQLDLIDHLREEKRLLKERLGGRPYCRLTGALCNLDAPECSNSLFPTP
jgi:hypothetical protein